jgi:cytochrome P450
MNSEKHKKAFTSRNLEELKPHIVEIVEELLKLGMVRGEMNLLTELAHPLIMRVMAEMLGLPPADQERFLQWAQQLLMQLVGIEHYA